jgi:hypothetical protein
MSLTSESYMNDMKTNSDEPARVSSTFVWIIKNTHYTPYHLSVVIRSEKSSYSLYYILSMSCWSIAIYYNNWHDEIHYFPSLASCASSCRSIIIFVSEIRVDAKSIECFRCYSFDYIKHKHEISLCTYLAFRCPWLLCLSQIFSSINQWKTY